MESSLSVAHRTKSHTAIGGRDGEEGSQMSMDCRRDKQESFHLSMVRLSALGWSSGLHSLPHQHIDVMAAGEALLALGHMKAIANAISFPQG